MFFFSARQLSSAPSEERCLNHRQRLEHSSVHSPFQLGSFNPRHHTAGHLDPPPLSKNSDTATVQVGVSAASITPSPVLPASTLSSRENSTSFSSFSLLRVSAVHSVHYTGTGRAVPQVGYMSRPTISILQSFNVEEKVAITS